MKTKIVSIFICALLIAVTVPSLGEPVQESLMGEVVIWEQGPDTTGDGINVRCDRNDGVKRTLANDFRCTVTGPIIRVHLFGSWRDNEEGVMTKIHLSIHEDIPVEESPTEYSMPGDLLWQKNFTDFESDSFPSEWEWWWDPYNGTLIDDCDNVIWEYIIEIDESEAFVQLGTPEEPIIYWLDVWVESESGEFGWKTAEAQYIDDAVYYVKDDDPFWFELIHPMEGNSLDLACKIIGKGTPTPPDIVVIVDDLIDISLLNVLLRNEGNITVHDIPWTINISGGLLRPTSPAEFTGTLDNLQPDQDEFISTDTLLGLGPIEVTVTVDGCEPVTFRGFILFFLILCFKP